MITGEVLQHCAKHRTPWHQHETGQIYWVERGIVMVQSERGQWLLTPGSVGWFPPELRHCAWVPDKVEGHSLYLEREYGSVLPVYPCIWGTDRFLLQLLARVFSAPHPAAQPEYRHHLLTLMFDELLLAPTLTRQLILPTDRRAKLVAQALLMQPDKVIHQQQLAALYGLSVRTLSRLFRQQTGLSFSQWRQHARLFGALEWLLAGQPVSGVAERCGYQNVSAFIAAFKRLFMVTPGYFQRRYMPHAQ